MNGMGRPFFVAGGSLSPEAPSYVERRADGDLFDALLAGEICHVLDTRQVGKTSLMVRTAARLRAAGVRVGAVDLSALGQNVTLDQWYHGILYSLASSFDEEEAGEKFWRDHADVTPVQRLIRAVCEVLLEADETPLVIFIDEIDAIRSLGFHVDELFAAIRALYNARAERPGLARLTFCLIGVATPTDLIRNPQTTPFNVGRRIELADFTAAEASVLASGLCEGPAGVAALRRVLHWTGGHPYLTQRLCRALVEDGGTVSPRLVDRVCGTLFLSRRSQETDDNLAFVRQRLLDDSDGADPVGTLLLYRELLIRPRNLRADPADPRVATLSLAGLARPSAGRLRVRCLIYARAFSRRWVDSSLPGEETRRIRRAVRLAVVRASSVWVGVFALLVTAAVQSFRAGGLQRTLRMVERETLAARRDLAELSRGASTLRAEQDRLRLSNLEVTRSGEQARAASRAASLAAARRLAETERQRIDASRSVQALVGESASGLAQISGRELEALGRGLQAVEPALREGREPPDLALQGLADAVNQRLVHRWARRMAFPLSGVAYSADGRTLAVCWDSADVLLVDAATGRDRARLRTGADVHSVRFSPDGRFMATYGHDGTLQLWRAGGRTSLIRTWRMGAVRHPSLAFTTGSARIVCSLADGSARAFAIRGDASANIARPHKGEVNDVAASQEDDVFATAGADGWVRVWRVSDGSAVGGHSLCTGRSLYPAALGLDSSYPVNVMFQGEQVISTGPDAMAIAWKWKRSQTHLLFRYQSGELSCIAGTGDDGVLATAAADRTVALWHSAGGRQPFAVIRSLGSTPTGIAADPRTGELCLVDQFGRIEAWSLRDDSRAIASGAVRCVANAGRSRTLCAAEGAVWSYPSTLGAERATRYPIDAQALAASPDGRLLAAAVGCRIVLQPLEAVPADGRGRHERGAGTNRSWAAHGLRVTGLAWSPGGGSLFSSGDDGRVREWDPATGVERRGWRFAAGLRGVALDARGRWAVAACRDGAAYAWPVTGDGPRIRLAPEGRVTAPGAAHSPLQAALSPDGRWALIADGDGRAHLFDAHSGRHAAALPMSGAQTLCVGFSPDGRDILTGGTDGAVRLWRMSEAIRQSTPLPRLALQAHVEAVVSAIFSGDGRKIITGSRDATIRTLPCSAAAYAGAARNMLSLATNRVVPYRSSTIPLRRD